MYLALVEMRRSLARYAIVTCSVGLVLFLILAQHALQTSLVASISGGIEAQSGEVLVLSVDAQRSPAGSFVTPDIEATVRDLEQTGDVASLRQSFATIVGADGAPQEVVIVGYAASGLGSPMTVDGERATALGQVVVSEPAARPTMRSGDTVRLERDGPILQVTGTAEQAAIAQLPTLWMTAETYGELLEHANPDAEPPPANVLAVAPRSPASAEELVAAIDALDPDLEALTREDAAAGLPQVEQIEQGFSMIFALFGLVLPAIVGLFFMITTLQKARPLTLLRALGVPPARLARSLLLQVAVVVSAGLAVGLALFLGLTRVGIGGLPIVFDPRAAALWSTIVLSLGLLSASFSARRVLRIDPIEATTGGGLGS